MKRTFIVFLTFVFYFSSFTHVYAATPKWVLEYIKVEKQIAEKKRLQALLIKQVNEAGSLTKTTAVVETVPTASKVGASMLQRIKHVAKTPGGAAIGVYAVGQLLEGIGWVMEEGTYVKKIQIEDTSNLPRVWTDANRQSKKYFKDYQEAGEYFCTVARSSLKMVGDFNAGRPQDATGAFAHCNNYQIVGIEKVNNPEYDPNANGNTKTVPITAALLGAAMMGTGYKDPDPNFNNDSINTGNWTGVPEAYTPDPSGVGNELYESLEAKADRAPKTSDGKPAPSGDTRYNNDLTSNDNANDRSWDDQGTKGEGGSEKDEEGNEKSWFNLPKWCVWAADNCEWHQEDKAHQAEEKEVWQDEKNHRDQEKGFWQTVKDWFEWSKESPDDEPDNDQPEPEIDDQGIFSRTFDTVFSLSKECPPDIPFELDTQYLKGSYQISLRWLCIIFTTLGYPLLFASNCLGIWILYETVIRKEIKVN